MKLLKTKALVLRSRPLGERDRLLSLLTLEQGKLSAVAPGARKIKSRLAAGVDYFTYGDFLLYKGRSLYTVNQLEVEMNFARIRGDIRAYACGMYLCELVARLVEEGQPVPPVFNLLLECLFCLNKKKVDGEILVRFFELKLLSLLGYRPYLTGCLKCGDEQGPFFWNNEEGAIFCRRCCPHTGEIFPFAKGTLALANFLLEASPERIGKIRAGVEQKKELQHFTEKFIQYWTTAGFLRGLAFLEEVYSYSRHKS